MMISSFFWIPLITSVNLLASASEEASPAIPLGYIVLGVVIIPVVSLIITSIIDSPRTFKIPLLFVVSLVVIAGGLLLGFVVFGTAVSLVFPK